MIPKARRESQTLEAALTAETDAQRQGAETQIVLQRTHRYMQFNFRELFDHDPNREHEKAIAAATEEARANGSEPKRMVRIDFVNVEPGGKRFILADTVEVDLSDLSEVQRLAEKYMRKGYYLFGKGVVT